MKASSLITCLSTLLYFNSLRVQGTPRIVEVTPIPCRTAVKVVWQANETEINLPHRIRVRSIIQESRGVSHDETPSNTDWRETAVTNLLASSEYILQIQACKTSDCDEYNATEWRNVTTRGIPNPPINASSRLYTNHLGSICFVEWNRPLVIGDRIMAYQVTAEGRQNASNNDIIKLVYNATDTFCAFNVPPRRNYSITVQTVVCSGFSTATLANTTCNALDDNSNFIDDTATTNATTVTEPINAFEFAPFSLLVGAGAMLVASVITLVFCCLIRCCRKRKGIKIQAFDQVEDHRYEAMDGASGENVDEKTNNITEASYASIRSVTNKNDCAAEVQENVKIETPEQVEDARYESMKGGASKKKSPEVSNFTAVSYSIVRSVKKNDNRADQARSVYDLPDD